MARNLKRFSKIAFINLIVISFIFSVLEVITRLLYPQLIGEVYKYNKSKGLEESGLTRGVTTWSGMFNGNTRLNRIPYKGAKINNDSPLFIIIGDSISGGYGSPHEDIYWSRLQRKHDLDGFNKEKITFVSIGGYGNNLQDSEKALNDFIKKNNANVKFILYQFNFNDVMPYSKKDLKDVSARNSPLLSLKFNEFRYQYLNKSAFLRLLQLYSATFVRKTKGSCIERGLDSMGPYTWTFVHEGFQKQSKDLWRNYENNIIRISEIAKKNNAKFMIFISPILYDIDTKEIHPFYNRLNLDFSCATIDPKKNLRSIASKVGAQIIDPSKFVKDGFEKRVKEGNFKPFYFPGDENHFSPVAGEYISEYLYFSIFRDKD